MSRAPKLARHMDARAGVAIMSIVAFTVISALRSAGIARCLSIRTPAEKRVAGC